MSFNINVINTQQNCSSVISPVGIMVAGAKGVLRSMLCNGDAKGECIPVDFAINGIIGIARSVAMMEQKWVSLINWFL